MGLTLANGGVPGWSSRLATIGALRDGIDGWVQVRIRAGEKFSSDGRCWMEYSIKGWMGYIYVNLVKVVNTNPGAFRIGVYKEGEK